MIPKFGFGDYVISCEESDGIDFGIRILFAWKSATHHEILSNLNLLRAIPSFGVRNQLDLELPYLQVLPYLIYY